MGKVTREPRPPTRFARRRCPPSPSRHRAVRGDEQPDAAVCLFPVPSHVDEDGIANKDENLPYCPIVRCFRADRESHHQRHSSQILCRGGFCRPTRPRRHRQKSARCAPISRNVASFQSGASACSDYRHPCAFVVEDAAKNEAGGEKKFKSGRFHSITGGCLKSLN